MPSTSMDTLKLLKLSPHDAIIAMLNDVNGSAVDPRLVSTTQVQQLSGKRTTVTVTNLGLAPSDGMIVYEGTLDFEYNRLVLNDEFADTVFKFNFPLPTTSTAVVKALFEALRWTYDQDDFVEEAVTSSPYTLKAKPESRRWVGFIQIPLKP